MAKTNTVSAKRIIVSVSNDLSNDQRVHRICTSLITRYNVLLLGRKLKKSPIIEGRNYKTKRFSLLFNKGIAFYFCLNLRLFLFLLFNRSDILIANDLDTLLANTMAAKLKRKKLVYDSHELFTEVPELQDSNLKKKVWLLIERFCIKKVDVCYTVSDSIAKYYNEKYKIDMQVVRNLPTKKTIISDFKNRENIIIYQGALNKERGLEIMIDSMKQLSNWKLVIAGKGDLEKSLKEYVTTQKLNDKVLFTGNLDFETLHKLTNTAKIGLSLEQGTSLNYRYALPNKIFDYIQAGVPVICSDMPEMKAVINEFGVGQSLLITEGSSLAGKIIELEKNPEKLFEYNKKCIIASNTLNWENEEKILQSLFF